MSAPKTRRVDDGVYEVTGSADRYGQPYRVAYLSLLRDQPWAVFDSRWREVSTHFTKADAIKSVEVAR